MNSFALIQAAIFDGKLKPGERTFAENMIKEHGEEVFAAFVKHRSIQMQPSELSQLQRDLNKLFGISPETFAKYNQQ